MRLSLAQEKEWSFVLEKSLHDLKGPLAERGDCYLHFGVKANTSKTQLSCAYELNPWRHS